MASSPAECLRRNRADTIEVLEGANAIEAVSMMASNICFLTSKPGLDDICVDFKIFRRVLDACVKEDIARNLVSNFHYAQRLNAAEPTSLEGEEVDFLHSLINGILTNQLAFQTIGQPIDLGHQVDGWIQEFLETRVDAAVSESRMSRNNPIFVRSSRLLEMLQQDSRSG